MFGRHLLPLFVLLLGLTLLLFKTRGFIQWHDAVDEVVIGSNAGQFAGKSADYLQHEVVLKPFDPFVEA